MKYFRLSPDCFLVEGNNEGTLYDVHRCRIFLLDERAYRIIRKCGDNQPLGEWLGKSGMRFLQLLRDEDLGCFDSAPAYVDKMLLRSPVEWKGFCMEPPRYFRMDWGITNSCDLDCNFCARVEETVSWQSCQTCLRRDKNVEVQWWHEHPEDVITQIADLGVKLLHIRGGNPLLAYDTLQAIVQAVQSYPRLALVITTPSISKEAGQLLQLCGSGQVRFNIVLFGADDGSRDSAPGSKSIWRHQMETVSALVAAGHPPFLTFLLSKSTKQKRHEFEELAQARWNIKPSFSEIYMREVVQDGFCFSHIEGNAKPLSGWRSVDEFFFRVRFNTCTHGNFEISADGKVRPCAGLHKICGDITKGGLRAALSGQELYEIWELGKRSIHPCHHCALRFACADCTAVELEGAQDPVLKKAYCPYDPKSGEQRAYLHKWSPPEIVRTLCVEK